MKFGKKIRERANKVITTSKKYAWRILLVSALILGGFLIGRPALSIIKSKREAAENKVIKIFEEEPGLQILNGRYGPYISYEKKNYKIPENVEPKDLNLDACFKVIELQKVKGETKKARYSKKK